MLSSFLDPSFGTGGIVTSQFTGPVNDSAQSVLLQQGDKMIVVGDAGTAVGPAIAVARYNSDGSLDTTFGTGGKATTFPPFPLYAEEAALDLQGNILVVGQAAGYGPLSFIVARLNGTTGALDTTFNGTGEETVPLTSTWGLAPRVTVDSLGRIVMAGGAPGELGVTRLNSDGSLDTTFNGTGLSNTGVGAESLMIDSNGNIIVVGEAYSGPFCAVRLTSNGSLDPSFNGSGHASYTAGPYNVFMAATIDGNGRIVMVGNQSNVGHSYGNDIAVMRLNRDGSLDTTFNGTGLETINIGPVGSTWDTASGVAVDSTGKIVVAGRSISFGSSTTASLIVARLNGTDGSLDTTFGPGTGIETFAGDADSVAGVAIDSTGQIDVAGTKVSAGTGTGQDFVVATLDGNNGGSLTHYVTTDIPGLTTDSGASNVAIQKDGKIVVVDSSSVGIAVARYDPDGSLDSTFGIGGVARTTANRRYGDASAESVAVDSNTGQIAVAGLEDSSDSQQMPVLILLDSNGNEEKVIPLSGIGSDPKVAIDSQSRIIVAGSHAPPNSYSGADLVVIRLNGDGSTDSSFGSSGQGILTGLSPIFDIAGVAIDPTSGAIVVAGTIWDGYAINNLFVARLDSAGVPDDSFGSAGEFSFQFVPSLPSSPNPFGVPPNLATGVAVDAAGRIVVSASSDYNLLYGGHFAVARIDSNGTLDTTFNGTGLETLINGIARGVAIDQAGRIVVAGTTQGVFAAVRLNPDGALDSNFGSGGEVTTNLGAPVTTFTYVAGVAVDPTDIILAGGRFDTTSYYGSSSFALVRLLGGTATNTTVVSSTSPSVVGQMVTLTATVAPTGGVAGTPTGEVDFFDTTTDTELGSATLSSSGSASITVGFAAASTHTIVAHYVGDSSFASDWSPGLSQTVAALTSQNLQAVINTLPTSGGTVTIASPDTTALDTALSAVAGLSVVSGSTIGIVLDLSPTVYANIDGSGAYLPIDATAPANTTLTLSGPASGSATVFNLITSGTVTIQGNVTVLNSTSTTLMSSANSSVSGQAITLTATVTSSGGVPGTPTGAVDFVDSVTGNDLGSATLSSNGSASIMAPFYAVETHTIVAHYAGAPGYAPSESSTLTETVTALTPQNLQAVINTLPTSGGTVTIASPDTTALDTALSAVAGLSVVSGSTVGIVLDLGPADYANVDGNGVYQPIDATAPANTTLTLSGPASGSATLHDLVTSGTVTIQGSITVLGSSPALIVLSGMTKIAGGVTLRTTTDAPTILVVGGTLTLRDSTVVQESTLYDQVAIQNTGGTVDLGTYSDPGGNTIQVNGVGALIQDTSPNAVPPSLSGVVYEDFNNDGQVDFGEAGIAGVTIDLVGTDVLGNSIHLCQKTDDDGAYVFLNLQPGSYTITETQPASYLQGINTVGTAGGMASGDQFAVNLPPDLAAMNYNFGELPTATSPIQHGQTAGIGFWNNKNGQALIKGLNGGGTSTQLGDWLAATFPHMFGAEAGGNDLSGQTNDVVAAFFQARFVLKDQKLDAQVLATALAVYVTNATLDATGVGSHYGFTVSGDGVGTASYNVGTNGDAFGVADGTTMTVMDILLATDAQAIDGVLYNGDGTKRDKANHVFSGINQAGSI